MSHSVILGTDGLELIGSVPSKGILEAFLAAMERCLSITQPPPIATEVSLVTLREMGVTRILDEELTQHQSDDTDSCGEKVVFPFAFCLPEGESHHLLLS